MVQTLRLIQGTSGEGHFRSVVNFIQSQTVFAIYEDVGDSTDFVHNDYKNLARADHEVELSAMADSISTLMNVQAEVVDW